MRAIVYAITALAAVGIVVAIGMMPASTETTMSEPTATTVASSNNVMAESGTLVLKVPDMHCPFACYPAVKSTLEKEQAVESVELTEQKEEGVLDRREVIVNYDAGFDVDAAIAALAQKGFAKAEIVQ